MNSIYSLLSAGPPGPAYYSLVPTIFAHRINSWAPGSMEYLSWCRCCTPGYDSSYWFLCSAYSQVLHEYMLFYKTICVVNELENHGSSRLVS